MTLREIDGGTNYYAQFQNGLPTAPTFFPIGVWFESILSQGDVTLDKAAGINTYVVLTANSNLSLLQPNGMYAILQQSEWKDNPAAIANPNVVGWELHDEIDMQQGPGQGYTTLQNIINSLPNDERMTWNNYGKGVTFWETDQEAQRFINDFQDVSSVDIYWFTDPFVDSQFEGGEFLGLNRSLTEAETDLAANYGYVIDRMRFLDGMDGERQPIWGFVEVGWPFTETAAQGGEAIAPDEIQAAVMHQLIAGAQGITYFNHSFGGPNQTQHALRDPAYAEVRAAVTEINQLITQLAPVLNSPFDDGYVTTGSGVRVMAKFYQAGDQDHYVFAGSTQHAASTATFTLAGANPDMDGTAIVINEGRTITITDGVFQDFFADGEAWHVYHIELGTQPDTTPPAKPIIASFSDDTSPTGDGRTTDTTLGLTGTAEANSTVTVFDGATNLGSAPVDDSGAWSFSTAPLSLSTHTFTAKATDAAGNISVTSDALVVAVEAPPLPEIIGTTGNDVLVGTNNADTIRGLAGNDSIDGRDGADTLFGDAGADTFVFRTKEEAAGDKVMDLVHGVDKLDFSLIDARQGKSGNQAFHFDGYTGRHTNGDVWLVEDQAANVTHVYADTGPTVFHIDLAGTQLGLTAIDFIL